MPSHAVSAVTCRRMPSHAVTHTVDFDQVLRLAVEEQRQFRLGELARLRRAFTDAAMDAAIAHGIPPDEDPHLPLHEFLGFAAKEMPPHIQEGGPPHVAVM